MIFELFFIFFNTVIGLFGSLLPGADSSTGILHLPWGLDTLMIYSITMFKAFVLVFPPAGTVFTAFMIYVGYRVVLQFMKAIPLFGRSIN